MYDQEAPVAYGSRQGLLSLYAFIKDALRGISDLMKGAGIANDFSKNRG